ncbi:MAG: zinc dependent phospholipase C family protein [Clostridia bacterium]|nr:zinc dependent phospholipase C family protein [Clostridia bacterium]
MPDIVVHRSMGEDVYARLNMALNRNIFAFGLLGPDPYLFYRFYIPPFRHRINRYSSVMHRERTGDFITELGKGCRGVDEFSYLAGFLCHYALDSTAHPFIIEKAKGSAAMHLAIEHRLDILDGGKIRIPPFPPPTMKEYVGGAIEKIYGWADAWQALAQGHSDMAPFYRLVEDKSGALDKALGWTRSAPAMLSYKSHICDDMDLSAFRPLYNRAVEDAVRFIHAAKAYAQGETNERDFRDTVGNRSYIDG